jgi:SAM-dependent methyltransferase
VLDLGCGLGGASRYLATECGCRVAAIDLTPNFVEAARILTARCGLADRVEIQQANALALPFQDATFDHVWSYAVTMNIADKEGLGREVARVLKPGGHFSCNEIARGSGDTPVFPLPWATDEASSFLATPAAMRTALEAGGLSAFGHDTARRPQEPIGAGMQEQAKLGPLARQNLSRLRRLRCQITLPADRIGGRGQPLPHRGLLPVPAPGSRPPRHGSRGSGPKPNSYRRDAT